MARKKTVRPAPVATGNEPQNSEHGAALDYFDTATLIALQSKKLARRFGLTDATARVLSPFIFGEAMR
jgi:hypothetical protein